MSNGDDSLDDATLDRFLAGEASDIERRRVEAWMRRSPARAALARSIVEPAALGASPVHWNTANAWKQLEARIAAAPPVADIAPAALTPVRSRRAPVFAWAAAAVLLVAAVGGVLVLRKRIGDRSVQVATEEIATRRGERREVRLEQGSTMTLGPASRVVVRREASRLTVQLEGVALFSVAHDSTREFIVDTKLGAAVDIGTTFVVRAYPIDTTLEVAVAEGRVALRGRDRSATPVNLDAGQIGVVASSGTIALRRAADISRADAWARGRLVFDDRPLSDVAAELSRWFDVEIRMADSTLAQRRVTAVYSNPTLDGVLSALAVGVEARVERNGRVATFHREAAR
jgi:transmembrane sensor